MSYNVVVRDETMTAGARHDRIVGHRMTAGIVVEATSAPRAAPLALELRGLTKRYGALTAVSSVNLTVAPGEILGLLGPNGSGKSTTLNLVMGFIKPTAGEVIIDGHSLRSAPRAALREVGGLVEAAEVLRSRYG